MCVRKKSTGDRVSFCTGKGNIKGGQSRPVRPTHSLLISGNSVTQPSKVDMVGVGPSSRHTHSLSTCGGRKMRGSVCFDSEAKGAKLAQ